LTTAPTRAEFAAAVADVTAELKDADAGRLAALIARPPQAEPKALAGCGWADARLARVQAAGLIGMAPRSLYEFTSRANKARAAGDESPKWLPPVSEDGTWSARELVIWQAIKLSRLLRKPRWPDHERWQKMARSAHRRGLSCRQFEAEAAINHRTALAVWRELGYTAERAPDSILFPKVRRLVTAAATAVPPTIVRPRDVIDALARDGYHVRYERASRLLKEAGGLKLLTVEPDTNEGWIAPKHVAEAGGCSIAAITVAVKAGRLTPWARDRFGPGGRRLLFDYTRLRPGEGRYRTPLDIDWVPGGGGETWLKAADNGPLLRAVRTLLERAGDRPVSVPDVVAVMAQAGIDIPEKRAAVLLALA
jgi:hypothetical protein